MEIIQLWEVVQGFLGTSRLPLGLRLLPVKEAFNIWQISPIPTFSFWIISITASEGAVMDINQLWEVVQLFLGTSRLPFGLRLLPVKGDFNIWQISPIPTLSFRRSRNGDHSTLKGGSIVFGDLKTASWIEATAHKRGVQHLADLTNFNFELPKEP